MPCWDHERYWKNFVHCEVGSSLFLALQLRTLYFWTRGLVIIHFLRLFIQIAYLQFIFAQHLFHAISFIFFKQPNWSNLWFLMIDEVFFVVGSITWHQKIYRIPFEFLARKNIICKARKCSTHSYTSIRTTKHVFHGPSK